MSADFSRLMAALAEANEAHADRDGLTGVRRTLFLMNGGRHYAGSPCPSEKPEPEHQPWCDFDECNCGVGDS